MAKVTDTVDTGIATIKRLARELDPEPSHAFQVRKNAIALFDAMQPLHGMEQKDRRLLEAAALLHDVGYRVSPKGHHKHSRDMVKTMELTAFSNNERDMIACIARYHRKAHPKPGHTLYSALSNRDKTRVRKLAAILRIADGLDRSHCASCKRISVASQQDKIEIHVEQRSRADIDIDGARRKSGLFEEVFKTKVCILPTVLKKPISASWLLVLFSAVFAGCVTSNQHYETAFSLSPGDLLFQDLDAGPLCDAIETVTQGVDGAKFSHVGMLSRADGHTSYVIEAVGAGVVETPLKEFLARSGDETGAPKVLVGRLKDTDPRITRRAIDIARGFLGRPYDTVFQMENSAFYCSELIYEVYRSANGGEPVFELNPMTFIDPATHNTFPAWIQYYAELETDIPEGKPGLNPGGMSRSPRIEILYAYGTPAGWQGSPGILP